MSSTSIEELPLQLQIEQTKLAFKKEEKQLEKTKLAAKKTDLQIECEKTLQTTSLSFKWNVCSGIKAQREIASFSTQKNKTGSCPTLDCRF